MNSNTIININQVPKNWDIFLIEENKRRNGDCSKGLFVAI